MSRWSVSEQVKIFIFNNVFFKLVLIFFIFDGVMNSLIIENFINL